MSEKIREDFDAWTMQYGFDDGEHMWQAWQASRAALVVELPRCWSDEARDYRDDLVEALDECGITHK